MTVWIVSLEWNQPPSEVTGDTGICGVFTEEAAALACRAETQAEFENEGSDVYAYSMWQGRYCETCGKDLRGWTEPVHVCAPSPKTPYCTTCGSERTGPDDTCDKDHDLWDIDVHCTEHEVQTVFKPATT